MTRLDTTKLGTNWQLGDMPGFDPVEMKRRIQAEIRQENKGMTDEQIRERRRQAVEEDIRWRAEYANK